MAERDSKLHAVGFCGADDSVAPELLAAISSKYPWVEWGVLFREEKEGQPRFASQSWLSRLARAKATTPEMRLAAHLCSRHCERVLSGDSSDVRRLVDEVGIRRFQINATVANNVNVTLGKAAVDAVQKVMEEVPEAEFIIQRNEETRALWEGLAQSPPRNMSFLYDDSVGRGVTAEVWPTPASDSPPFGYAGGLSPRNVREQVDRMLVAAEKRDFWIDMESSLRTMLQDGSDLFDVNKAMNVILQVAGDVREVMVDSDGNPQKKHKAAS